MDRLLVAAVVVAAVLRLWGIGTQSLWYDEWLTAEAATGSLTDLARYIKNSAGIPPTYFSVMWIWARVVGDGDGTLRVFSALIGMATVPLAYAVAGELGQPRRVARFAAVLVAVNPMLVWYSQEARPYSLVAFFGALSLWALARVWARGRRVDFAVWAVVCAGLVAVHYFALFLVAAEVLGLAVLRRHELRDLRGLPARWHDERREWFRAFLPAAIVLAGLAPAAVVQFLNREAHQWITDYSLPGRLRDAGASALVGPSTPGRWAWMVVAAAVLVALVMLVARGDRAERRTAAAVAALGPGTVGLALAATAVGVDVIIERYLIVVLIPLVLAAAIGFGVARGPRWIGAAGVAAVCLVSGVVVAAVAREPDLQRSDWRSVAEAHDAVGTEEGARLLVFNAHGFLGRPLVRYLDDTRLLGREDEDESVLVERIDMLAIKPADTPCNGFIGQPCAMIFLSGPPPEHLAEHFTLAERVDLDQFVLERYVADRPLRLTAGDVDPPGWDGQRRGLVLVSED